MKFIRALKWLLLYIVIFVTAMIVIFCSCSPTLQVLTSNKIEVINSKKDTVINVYNYFEFKKWGIIYLLLYYLF